MLLEAWRQFEAECGSRTAEQCAAGVAAVEKRMPKRIKRKVCTIAALHASCRCAALERHVLPSPSHSACPPRCSPVAQS